MKKPQALTLEDLVYFFQQLATLIAAGVSLTQSLALLAQAQEKKSFRSLIQGLGADLENGREFHQALQRFPPSLDRLTCSMLSIGEKTGSLEQMLKQVAAVLHQKLALRQQLSEALTYPLLLALAALSTSFILLFFIVPHFATLFENFPHQLPRMTRAIIFLSKLLRQWSLVLLLGFLMLAGVIYKSRLYQASWEEYLFKLPYLRGLMEKLMLLRFVRHLATALAASVPLAEALVLLSSQPYHPRLREGIQLLYTGINSGRRFHTVLAENTLYPLLLVQMTKTGEESGTLELMLEKFADLHERELQRSLTRLSQLLEPLIISILGVLIGGIVIAMYLPLFQLGTVI